MHAAGNINQENSTQPAAESIAQHQFLMNFSLARRLVIDVEAFERLLGPCMDLMKRNIDDYESQLVKIFGSKTNIADIR
jgi:hypothetical protein